MTPYRHIVWDWNGTLLDDVLASVNTINRLLADRAMPRKNGDQFALESKKIAPDTPIFMLTGFGGITVTDQNRPPGVDVVAGKPATSQEIREILDRLILAKKSE